jgi:hypothetical protein
MDDLYGPALGYTTPHVPAPLLQGERTYIPSPSEDPEERELMVLPALAATDPHILGLLEQHEQRKEAHQCWGMRKIPAACSVGGKPGGFVLVARQTEAEMEWMERTVHMSQWVTRNNLNY